MRSYISLKHGSVSDTFFTPDNIALAEKLGDVRRYVDNGKKPSDVVAEEIGNSEVYITLWGSPRLDAQILKNAPDIKLLTHLGGTVVPFVSDELWERGVRVISGNAFFAESVAEGTLAYILAALRDIPHYSERMKRGRGWKTDTDYTAGLSGKRIGIVSYGAIARNLVSILSQFRVELYVYDIKPLPPADVEKYNLHQATLEEIFSGCDVISLHTPLFDKTFHLIDRKLLTMIKSGALFVNTSRGAIVDQSALEDELARGRFRAVLDVYEKEPPDVNCRLYDMPNVMMIPHMAGPTVDLRSYITRQLLLESAAFIDEGKPLIHEITRDMASVMSRK